MKPTTAVDAMLRPNSVAIVGASERTWQGSSTFHNLTRHQYPGEVFLVNPRHDSQFGRPCYRSVSDLPQSPDVAVIGLGADRALDALAECAEVGVRSAVIFTDGFREAGYEGIERQRRVAEIARAAGMAVCGPNSMGLVSARHAAPLWLGALSAIESTGTIAAIVQSGSVGIALLNAGRGLRFGYLVSTGNEAVTTAADYLEAVLADDHIEVIVSHLETVNAGERYLAALETAHRAGKAVVVLKTGSSAIGQRMVAGHTGSITGADLVARSLLKQCGAILVESQEELVETLVLLVAPRRLTGRRAGFVTISGGYSGLTADRAGATGLDVPDELVGPRGRVRNLVDAWGNGSMETTVAPILTVAATASNTDFLAVVHDLEPDPVSGRVETGRALAQATATAAAATTKPVVWITPTPKALDQLSDTTLADAGVPRLSGLTAGIAACSHVAHWAARGELETRPPVTGVPVPGSDPTGPVLTEYESKAWLETAGVTIPPRTSARCEEEAVVAAQLIGYPVVLKKQVVGVEHKTALGYVRLDIIDEPALRRNYRELTADDAAEDPANVDGVLVEKQIPHGIELIVSAFVDASFGRVVILGFGGVINDICPPPALRLAPVPSASARAMIGESGLGQLIDKLFANDPRTPIDQVADLIVKVSNAFAEGPSRDRGAVCLVEMNPVIVALNGSGVVAVDALVQKERGDGSTPAGNASRQ